MLIGITQCTLSKSSRGGHYHPTLPTSKLGLTEAAACPHDRAAKKRRSDVRLAGNLLAGLPSPATATCHPARNPNVNRIWEGDKNYQAILLGAEVEIQRVSPVLPDEWLLLSSCGQGLCVALPKQFASARLSACVDHYFCSCVLVSLHFGGKLLLKLYVYAEVLHTKYTCSKCTAHSIFVNWPHPQNQHQTGKESRVRPQTSSLHAFPVTSTTPPNTTDYFCQNNPLKMLWN